MVTKKKKIHIWGSPLRVIFFGLGSLYRGFLYISERIIVKIKRLIIFCSDSGQRLVSMRAYAGDIHHASSYLATGLVPKRVPCPEDAQEQ